MQKERITVTLVSQLIVAGLILFPSMLYPLNVGDTVPDIAIRDANDKNAKIPDLGNKVLAIFYTDPDVSDMNDPMADALKAAKIKEGTFRGIGVANLKDAPFKPNAIVRYIIRGKIEKYDSTILTDPSLILAREWDLGEANDLSIFILVDKEKKVRYIKRGPIRGAEIERVVELVRELVK